MSEDGQAAPLPSPPAADEPSIISVPPSQLRQLYVVVHPDEMIANRASIASAGGLLAKYRDLTKFRLSSMVVASAMVVPCFDVHLMPAARILHGRRVALSAHTVSRNLWRYVQCVNQHSDDVQERFWRFAVLPRSIRYRKPACDQFSKKNILLAPRANLFCSDNRN